MSEGLKKSLVGASILLNALAVAVYIDGYHQFQRTKMYEALVAEYEDMAVNDSDMLINCTDVLDGADMEVQLRKAKDTFIKKEGNMKVINAIRNELGLEGM